MCEEKNQFLQNIKTKILLCITYEEKPQVFDYVMEMLKYVLLITEDRDIFTFGERALSEGISSISSQARTNWNVILNTTFRIHSA